MEPDQANFDTEARQLVDGEPGRLGDHRLPGDVPEVRAVARANGQVGRLEDVHDRGAPEHRRARHDRQPGRRAARHGRERGRRPGRRVVRGVLEEARHGAKPYTGFEGTALDAANVAFLAALQGVLGLAREDQGEPGPRSRGRPGVKVTYPQLAKAIKLVRAGKEIDYEGAFSPVDFDNKGDIGSAVFEIWKYDGNGQDRHA